MLPLTLATKKLRQYLTRFKWLLSWQLIDPNQQWKQQNNAPNMIPDVFIVNFEQISRIVLLFHCWL